MQRALLLSYLHLERAHLLVQLLFLLVPLIITAEILFGVSSTPGPLVNIKRVLVHRCVDSVFEDRLLSTLVVPVLWIIKIILVPVQIICEPDLISFGIEIA